MTLVSARQQVSAWLSIAPERSLAFRSRYCSTFVVKPLMIAPLLLLVGAAPAGPTLGPIRLQLYYKTTGTLSGNVAPPARLSLWNTGAGEGDVKEPAEDLLVSVPIQMPIGRDMGENSDLPLTISVRTKAGKLLGSRTFSSIAIPYKDPVWSALWINGVQCAGSIIATASWGKQRRTAAISLDCGE